MPMNANTVMAMKTTSNGIRTGSSQASQADKPTEVSKATRAGVKQQIPVMTVPAIPSLRRFLRCMTCSLVYAPLLLGACSSGSSKYTPDESGSFTVYCDQSSLRWNSCYETAERLCGEKGYQIVSDDSGGIPATTTNIYEVPVIGGSMVIRCNE